MNNSILSRRVSIFHHSNLRSIVPIPVFVIVVIFTLFQNGGQTAGEELNNETRPNQQSTSVPASASEPPVNHGQRSAKVNSLAYGPGTLHKSGPEELAPSSTTDIEALPYMSQGYRYKLIELDGTPPTGFELPGFDDTSWNTGQAAFGFSVGYCSITQTNTRTAWPVSTQLLARKQISLPAGANNIRIKVMVDNDILGIYFNGVLITSGGAVFDGCPPYDHQSFAVPENLVTVGNNTIAYRLRDRGFESFFDTRILFDLPPSPSLTSVDPSSPISNNVDQIVTVNGTNFLTGLSATLTFPNGGTGTLSGTQIQNVGPTSFKMRVTLGAPGSWNVKVNNPSGVESNSLPFTVQGRIEQPIVFTTEPSAPVSSPTDQDIAVFGANFKPDLTVDVTFPGGGGTTLSGAQIQNVTANSFIMRATLSGPGNYGFTVRNQDNQTSAPFMLTVSNGANNPYISQINPAPPAAGGADQNLIVTGGNFQSGLRVNATFPDGGVRTLQGTGQIQNVTATSFKLRITLNAGGAWKIRVVNPDYSQSPQFQFNVAGGPPPTGLPTSVLSPVTGPIRNIPPYPHANDGVWEFNQHKTGEHSPTGGLSLSNDTYAWDANLYTPTNGNADVGRTVFAVASGQVVSFVSREPGGGWGAVLIAHPNAATPVWFSGYQHMTNVPVTIGQFVTSTTVIGAVGGMGADNEHLHFVVYSGSNTRGNLRSFDTTITERTANEGTITSIDPPTALASSTPRPITITGTGFDASAMIEGEDPNGSRFPITATPAIAGVSSSRITSISATVITAEVRFSIPGAYRFYVINRNPSAKGSPAQSDIIDSNGVEVSGGLRHPVILIPGIMGSKLAKWNPGNRSSGPEIWPDVTGFSHSQLKDNIENPDLVYRKVWERNVVATDAIEKVDVSGRTLKKVYGPLISAFGEIGNGGYRVNRYSVPLPDAQGSSLCNGIDPTKDFFVFAYDWRNSNWTSAVDLDSFIECVRSKKGGGADFKVNIIAHSMGGLVARRYILNNPGSHYVNRMVSLGTPWLGAPDSINALAIGDLGALNWVMHSSTVREITPFLRGLHEILPSAEYHRSATNEPAKIPFGEQGWDFDDDAGTNGPYTWPQYYNALNYKYPETARRADTFHRQSGQDDWSNDTTGVFYYSFLGKNITTLSSLRAIGHFGDVPEFQNGFFVNKGDGTVPEISSSRSRWLVGIGTGGRVEREKRIDSNHGGLVSEGKSTRYIDCVINYQDPNSCLDGLVDAFGTGKSPAVNPPSWNMSVMGSDSVVLFDSFGNTSDPLSSLPRNEIETISTNVTGHRLMSASFPLDQTYRAVIAIPEGPLRITLLGSDGQTITEAVRYVDLLLPAGALALIEITAQGPTVLKYDSDGNGTFDTPVTPTKVVTGPLAVDTEAPDVKINETASGGSSRVVLEAADLGSGVEKIMFSFDGTTFQQYDTPLLLNPAQSPTIYVFADDNVANRSSLISHNLTASNAGFAVSAPTVATAGSSIFVGWNAPVGRPAYDWVGLFRTGTLNSAFLSKQFTEGLVAGNTMISLPNEVGAYEIRYLLNNGFTSVAVSQPINVTGSTSRASFDFDGDAKSDISIFRPNGASGAEWWWLKSSGGNGAVQFGGAADNIAVADFTGDGKTDVTFWRPSTGQWFVLRSEDLTFYAFPFGATGDVPVPADFDGDGKADAAVFRPTTLTWYISKSTGGTDIVGFGANGDKPVVADYDGDSKADIAVFRPSGANGAEWWIRRSSNSTVFATQFGSSTDKAVPADYTGDGKADIAFWTPSSGNWFVLRSEDFSYFAFPFGSSTDIPSPGDYDGDGKMDAAVFRPSNSTWYAQRSTAGLLIQQFGAAGDVPVPSAFVR